MEGVRALFGVVFFGVGLYYLRLVVPGIREAIDTLWSMMGAR